MGKSKQPGFTEPTLVLCSPARLTPHQVSARFRPRTTTDSPALHPLHSSLSPAFRRTASAPCRFRLRSDGRKLARQAEQLVLARKSKTPEAARLRHGPNCNMGAMLRMSPRTSNSPRCFARARHRNTARGSAYRRGPAIVREASPGQDTALTVSTASFRPLLRLCARFAPKLADPAGKTKLV